MNQSPKLLMICGAFCIFVILGLVWVRCHQKIATKTIHNSKTATWDVASGDTNNEVLRTVIAHQQALEAQNKKIKDENAQLKQHGLQELQQTMLKTQHDLEQKIINTKQVLQAQLQQHDTRQQQKNSDATAADYSLNDSQDANSTPHAIGDISDLSESLQPTINENKTMLVPQNNAAPNILVPHTSEDEKAAIPYYTIPANSTLNHVSMMSSIIGEVPVSGHLIAPAFPFKAIIGRKDLFAANGFSVPQDIAGMVVEGYAVGNMTMSCARAYVTRALFVFNDGHFVVYPTEDKTDATNLYPKEALGYLSDQFGNTCLTGKYLTDAPKVIATMAALGGVAAGGAAVAQSQMTQQSSSYQTTAQLTGNVGKYMGGAFVNGASQKALQWYTTRVSDIFDAVFIPATMINPITHHMSPTQVVLNITQTIPLDLEPHGRTLRYDHITARLYHTELD